MAALLHGWYCNVTARLDIFHRKPVTLKNYTSGLYGAFHVVLLSVCRERAMITSV